MKEITIKEIAEKLGLSQPAAKARLYRLEIKPVRLVGNTGIYDPSVIEKIKEVKPVGRPPKEPAKKKEKPVKKK